MKIRVYQNEMSERETREDERKGKKGQGAANEEQIDTWLSLERLVAGLVTLCVDCKNFPYVAGRHQLHSAKFTGPITPISKSSDVIKY